MERNRASQFVSICSLLLMASYCPSSRYKTPLVSCPQIRYSLIYVYVVTLSFHEFPLILFDSPHCPACNRWQYGVPADPSQSRPMSFRRYRFNFDLGCDLLVLDSKRLGYLCRFFDDGLLRQYPGRNFRLQHPTSPTRLHHEGWYRASADSPRCRPMQFGRYGYDIDLCLYLLVLDLRWFNHLC